MATQTPDVKGKNGVLVYWQNPYQSFAKTVWFGSLVNRQLWLFGAAASILELFNRKVKLVETSSLCFLPGVAVHYLLLPCVAHLTGELRRSEECLKHLFFFFLHLDWKLPYSGCGGFFSCLNVTLSPFCWQCTPTTEKDISLLIICNHCQNPRLFKIANISFLFR